MRGDSPPFKMKVAGDKLAPATAWDAERLASYRSGAEVSVVITQEVASWARRRYWAILGVVVKTCPVPSRVRTAQDLHDAIRKQIGFVDSHSSDGKKLTVKLRSTSKLDDQQFEAFAAEAYAELTAMTGVDVMTLGKEAADVGPRYEQPEDDLPSSTGSGSGVVDSTAPDDSAAADLPGSGEGAETASPAPKVSETLRIDLEECRDKFLHTATDASLSVDDKRFAVAAAKRAWMMDLPMHESFVLACVESVGRIVKGGSAAIEREYLTGLIEKALR